MKNFSIHTSGTILVIFSLFLFVVSGPAQEINIKELDRQAEEHFEKKDYNKAVAIWLTILDNNPDNERIQKRIETVYELKQQKDMDTQKSRLYYKITKKRFAVNKLKEGIDSGRESINSFISAYRIDPKDPILTVMLGDMKILENEINAAKEKLRVSEEMRQRYELLKVTALQEMEKGNYEEALKNWEKILSFFPKDVEAGEGKRKCRLAIDNRLKFDTIKILLAKGKQLFDQQDYKLARTEFVQVQNIDPSNREARTYIEDIDDKLEESRLYQQRLQQAEDFYVSGINNLKKDNFDLAEEDFDSCLALINNYKDARERLAGIERLRKEYAEREKARKFETINKEFQDGLIALSDARYSDAIAAFGRTLILDPNNSQAKKYLSLAQDAQKQVEEEIVDKNSPYYDIVNALTISGEDLYNKGQYQESRKKWEKILELFPKNKIANMYQLKCFLKITPDAYERVTGNLLDEGKTMLKKRDYKAARERFELIKSISATYPGIDRFLAQTGGARVIQVTDVSTVDLNTNEARYTAALQLYTKGGKENYLEALKILRVIVDKDPNNTKAIISLNKIEVQLRGVVLDIGGRKTNLTPEQDRLAKRYYNLGLNYYNNDEFRKAIDEWRKVLAIDPDNIKAKTNIRKTSDLIVGR